jgi:hypothetical protein
MVRWILPLALISVAFLFVARTPPAAPPQPVQFSHKLHLDFFQDGRHSRAMVAMHEELLGEVTEEIQEGQCTLCHGEFDEAVEITPGIRSCDCHRVFLDRDWEGRRDQRPCMACHSAVVHSPRASIPNSSTCAACHLPPLGTTPEEVQLVAFIEAEKPLHWTQVNDYLPGDIVFSHERHAELGGVACQRCHGRVERAERSLALEVELSMEDCMACHEASRADNDCLACHK